MLANGKYTMSIDQCQLTATNNRRQVARQATGTNLTRHHRNSVLLLQGPEELTHALEIRPGRGRHRVAPMLRTQPPVPQVERSEVAQRLVWKQHRQK